MRSPRGFAGAVTILASYVAALAVGLVFGTGAETVVHLLMGTGFVVVATSLPDFGLPRWINVVGAAAAGAFGVIFLLQGISDLTHVEGLRHLAFDVLGHELERFLPDVVYLWFVALLLWGSRGKSRVLGAVVMLVVVGLELATLASHLLGGTMASVKFVILLPFVWLVVESAERPRRAVTRPGGDRPTASTAS